MAASRRLRPSGARRRFRPSALCLGLPTHFIRRINMREQLIREVEIIPLEVVVRNVAAGSLATRLGLEEGTQLPRSIIEFYYKNDALNDPMVSEEHITAFGWARGRALWGSEANDRCGHSAPVCCPRPSG